MPPTDTKYLQLRNGIWYIRIVRPPKEWGLKGEYLHTLRTPDLKTAQMLRDKYLIPLLAETKALEMSKSLLRIISTGQESIKTKLQALGQDLGDDVEELTILKAFDKYIAFRQSTNTSPATIETFNSTRATVEKLFEYDMPLDVIDTRTITDYRDKLLQLPASWLKIKDLDDKKNKDKKKTSKTTINNHLVRFRTLWKWLEKEKHTYNPNPAEGITAGTSNKVKNDRDITIEECDRLINMPFPPKSKAFSKKCWRYMPVIARYTGARLAEIAQITTDDIEEVNGVLCINFNAYDGKRLKNQQSARTVPISDKLKEIIKPLINQCEKATTKTELFKHRGDYKDRICKEFSKVWSMKAKKIGEHCHFHGLRSYCITQMANAGIEEIDRMRITGHSNKNSHAGYTKTVLSRLKNALDCVP